MSRQRLQAWVDMLRTKNMPVLGKVITELNSITEDEESNAGNLAEVILRDPNLTSHVLRVANSVKYNYGKHHINTVSRSIVLIGLKGIRAICISLLILDRLLKDSPKDRVIALVAQGFHAASQAQQLVEVHDVAEAEEVFIAGLLFHLGEMAYWVSEDLGPDNEGILSDNPIIRKRTTESVLGGSFKDLTIELSQHWALGETLTDALSMNQKKFDTDGHGDDKRANGMNSKAQAVVVGERLSRAALFGWDSPQFKKVLNEVAEFRGVSTDEALADVKKAADKASLVAMSYGASDVCPLIPSSFQTGYFDLLKGKNRMIKADTALQLSILRELSAAVSEKVNVNTIFQMVLEGMHRGVGLERVALAFISSKKIQAKYVMGEGTEHWRGRFLFDVGPYTDNIFTYCIEQAEACWITNSILKENPELFSDDIVTIVGRHSCLMAVLKIRDRNAALFYADRGGFGGKIDQEQFESFRHFAGQAQFNLTLLSKE